MKGLDKATDADEKRQKKIDEYAGVAMGFVDPFADGLIDAAHGADVAWSEMFSNLVQNIEKAILKMLILKGIEAGLNAIIPGGGTIAVGSGAAGAIVGSTARSAPSGDSSRAIAPGGGRPMVAVNVVQDNRQLVQGMNSRAGVRVVADMRRKNPRMDR